MRTQMCGGSGSNSYRTPPPSSHKSLPPSHHLQTQNLIFVSRPMRRVKEMHAKKLFVNLMIMFVVWCDD